ncbi:hypothetical protein J6590_038797 [Homalodisca vitripennis]|nr:hypothetical protein J6590_038797 [Homalodisca vitripennis]
MWRKLIKTQLFAASPISACSRTPASYAVERNNGVPLNVPHQIRSEGKARRFPSGGTQPAGRQPTIAAKQLRDCGGVVTCTETAVTGRNLITLTKRPFCKQERSFRVYLNGKHGVVVANR